MRQIIEPAQLRRLLSANIKARRRKLGISQEKLAELTDLSVQMINSIEGCRAWISDKTLTVLAGALGIEVYQLFVPGDEEKTTDKDAAFTRLLMRLKQELTADITADIESRFSRLLP